MTDEVLSVMVDLARAGQTMVVVTHAIDFARRAANKVHVFHEGRVVESGPRDRTGIAARRP
jgi:ABC-type histidine transport system ATPase subunit